MTAWPDTSMREAVVAGLQDPAVMKSVRRQLLRAVSPPLVTDLPIGPQDGDEVYYLADATNGVVWHFRYRAGASSIYRWEFVGGSELFGYVGDSQESTTSTSYTTLTTAGPEITLPLSGFYNVRTEARMINDTADVACLMSYQVGASAALDVDSLNMRMPASPNSRTHNVRTVRREHVGGTTLSARYRVTGGTGGFAHRLIAALPIRVGRTR